MYYEVIWVNFRYFLRKSMIVVPALPLPQQSKRDPLGKRGFWVGVKLVKCRKKKSKKQQPNLSLNNTVVWWIYMVINIIHVVRLGG